MIRMAQDQWFSYILVQCADERRDECLNVGVLVYDSRTNEVLPRFELNLERIERALPNVTVSHLRTLLNNAASTVRHQLAVDGAGALAEAHATWRNLLRASPVRTFRAQSAEAALDSAFRRFVAIKHPRSVVDTGSAHPPISRFTDGRVVRSVRARLDKAGLREGRDYLENAQVTGFTRSAFPIPVWYPLQVQHTLFIDGIRLHDDLVRDFDVARLAAQKAEQTLRIPESRVVLAIRDGNSEEVGAKVAEIIESDGRVGERGPMVYRHSDPDELDQFVRELVGQPSMV